MKISNQHKQTLSSGLIAGFGTPILAFSLNQLAQIIPTTFLGNFVVGSTSTFVAKAVHDHILQANPFNIASTEAQPLIAKSVAVLSGSVTAIAMGSLLSLAASQALAVSTLGFAVYQISQAVFAFMSKDDILRQEILTGLNEAFRLGRRVINEEIFLCGMWYSDYRQYLNKFPTLATDNIQRGQLEEWRLSGYLTRSYFTQNGAYSWYLQENKDAARALHVVLEGPSILECVTGAYVCFLYAIKRILGDAKFNQLFGGEDQKPLYQFLSVSKNQEYAPAEFFEKTEAALKGEMGEENQRPLEIGDWCYFEGVEGYQARHEESGGNGCGENVIYMGRNAQGEQLFMGFDFDKPVTEKQIKKGLIDLYCLPTTQLFSSEETGPALVDEGKFQVKGFVPSATKRLRLDVLKQLRSQELSVELLQKLSLLKKSKG